MERMMLENSTEVRKLNEQNEELYKELSEKTGSKITGPGGVGDLYATLRSEVRFFFFPIKCIGITLCIL